MEERIEWRIKQSGVVVACGFGPEHRALQEAAHYVLMYELDDAETMRVEVRREGMKRWKRVEVSYDWGD